jgi:acyl-CoA synthetase (AMP-forming)/AMP-acid ligase II
MGCLKWLLDRFETNSNQKFLIWRDQPFSYGWLLDHIQIWRERLDAVNMLTGTVVAIEGDYSPDTVALFLSLIERGAIIVPLTTSVAKHKPEFMEIAEVQVSILFSESEAGEIRKIERQVNNPLTKTLINMRESGLVLFSSGSTGKSKAALHSFSRLLEKFKQPRHSFVTLTFLLFDHIGGINTLLYVLSNSGTVVSIANRNPDRVCRTIEKHGVELLPTTPTFLNLLLISEAYKRYDLSFLKTVTYGTEPMPTHTLRMIRQVMPNAKFQQTYGLSELGILRSKSRNSDSLWVRVGGEGFETKIQDGRLWVRTHSAMLGYLNAPSPFDADGWFDTGDAVELDGEYIKILGRQSDIINVGGEKVYPSEVENVLLQMPNVSDAVVTGKPNPITGQAVVASLSLFEPEDISQLRRRTRDFCRKHLPAYKIPARIQIATKEQYSQRYKKMHRI